MLHNESKHEPRDGRAATESARVQAVALLGTLEEISRMVVSHTGDAAETLTNIARLIQQRLRSDVCSVYLMSPDRLQLVLSATIGLDPSSIGTVRMRMSEGLVGLVGELLQPQVVADAPAHPRFKYFAGSGEEVYRSFLGVPLVDRGLLQGVLVVQTIDARVFTPDEVRTLTMAAAQLAPLVSDTRVLHEVQLQAERLRVVQVTMRTVQDIVNNCLNQLQLFRLDADGHLPVESLRLFDEIVQDTAARLRAIGEIEAFAEREMEIGTSLDIGPGRV